MSDLDVVPQVEMEKENIADDLVLDAPMFKPPQLSPTKKPAKKSRSKSIGPGGLDVPLEVPLKAHSGNRRKVEWRDLSQTAELMCDSVGFRARC